MFVKKFNSVMVAGFIGLVGLVVGFSPDVLASSVEPGLSESTFLFDILSVLVGSERAAQWVAVIGLVAWVLTQLMAWLSPSVVSKLPRWVVALLNVLAGNYRKAKNEDPNTKSSSGRH